MAKSHLKLVMPATVKRTVSPRRARNRDLRTREYLTAAEVERLIEVVKGNRYGHRNAAMVLVALPARPTGVRTGGPSLGSGRVRHRDPTRP